MKFIVAIDGPSATGKSSVAKRVANHFGFAYIDTGKLYRALAYASFKTKIDSKNITKLILIIPKIKISISLDTRELVISFDGKILDQELLSEQVTKLSSIISSHEPIRKLLLATQRDLISHVGAGALVIGRDIGTVVFPKAPLKIFITANSMTRAQRRFEQVQNLQDNISYKDILGAMKDRDNRDQTRTHSPLQQASDSILIDTSNLSLEQVVKNMINLIDDTQKKYNKGQPLW